MTSSNNDPETSKMTMTMMMMTMIMMMMTHSPGVDPAHAWLPGKVETPAGDLVITHNSGTWIVKSC